MKTRVLADANCQRLKVIAPVDLVSFTIRKATLNDQTEIEWLIAESVRGLSREDYDERQIELSIKSVFGVDAELILDETYFVAEVDSKIVGCGGWSKRKTLYGASRYELSRDSEELNPERDAAKIRAFFIHPNWARKGICLLRVGVLDSLLGKDYIGKKLKTPATARNWRTVNKIAEF
ncbi:hypothetical protein BH24ACI1_BH24ACI1_22210 [soil metagenome]